MAEAAKVEPLLQHGIPRAPPWAIMAGFLGVAVLMTLTAIILPPPSYTIRVAFVGNSMMYVNDLPRFMQSLAGKSTLIFTGLSHIHQRSCLHGSLNFKSILRKGNGMYNKWQTNKAKLKGGLYDFGACTVPQLLLGYDENLEALNANGYYKNDGKNPCFRSEEYYDFLVDLYNKTTPQWDFVVMNDHTKHPAIPEKLEYHLEILQQDWVPMLLQTGAIPVLYATHGYHSRQINVTGMGNVSEFTSNVYEGYRQYAQLLAENLPPQQKPRIAPVGLAFLVVYEENLPMWNKLFYVDGLHPSPHGSYLMGVILYATLYGRMPNPTIAIPGHPKQLWRRARRMQIKPQFYMPYPDYEEARYLYYVARKIMLNNYRPKTWIQYGNDTEYYLGAD